MRSRKAPVRKRGKKEKESISFVNDHGRKKEMLRKMKIAAFALESGSIKTSLKKEISLLSSRFRSRIEGRHPRLPMSRRLRFR